MMPYDEDTDILKRLVQKAIRDGHPSTVEQLVQQIKNVRVIDDDDLVVIIRGMVREGSLKLTNPDYSHETLIDYFLTPALSSWFWITCLVIVLTIVILDIAPSLPALEVLRWTLGFVLVLYLPGYALIRFLRPDNSQMDWVEKYTLHIVASFTVTALVGVLLEYTRLGINLSTVTSSNTIFVLFFVVAAAIRDHERIRTNVAWPQSTHRS